MKSPKEKVTKKEVKKAKAKIEVDLTEKIKTFIKSLGHDAEDIGDEIKKASKILSKRLSIKLKDVKKTIDGKIKSATVKKEVVQKDIKKDVAKASDKLANDTKSVKKAVKKEIKPLVNQVKKAVEEVKTVSAKALAEKAAASTLAQQPAILKDDTTNAAHPETPAVSPKPRSRAKVAPKSDTKPENTDLPFNAGPKNKYKRG